MKKNCANKVKNTCGSIQYSQCVSFEGMPNEASPLAEETCLDQEIVTQDIYDQLGNLINNTSIEGLGDKCITYEDNNNVNKTLLTFEDEICNIKTDITTLRNSELCEASITDCGLDLKCLTTPCDTEISTFKELQQALIDGVCTMATPDGSETKIMAGTSMTVTGEGTTETPYVITSTISDGDFVHLTGNENIEGQKTFNTSTDNSAVIINSDNSPNYAPSGLLINGNNAASSLEIFGGATSGEAIFITHSSAYDAISLTNSGEAVGFRIENTNTDGATAIEITHNSDSAEAITIFNNGDAGGIRIDNGKGIGANITSNGINGRGIFLDVSSSSKGIEIVKNSTNTGILLVSSGTGNCMQIDNNNASARSLSISQGGTEKMFVNQGGEITAQKLIKSGGTSSQYLMADGSVTTKKVYKALLSQTGTSAPVPVILENTLGVVPTWSYSSSGQYTLTSTGLFTTTNTLVHITPDVFSGAIKVSASSNLNNISFRSYDQTNTPADSIWTRISLTIEVY